MKVQQKQSQGGGAGQAVDDTAETVQAGVDQAADAAEQGLDQFAEGRLQDSASSHAAIQSIYDEILGSFCMLRTSPVVLFPEQAGKTCHEQQLCHY